MPYKDAALNKLCKSRRYQETKHLWVKRANKKKLAIKKHIWSVKLKSKCKKCGEKHPAALDFHHRDPKQKEIGVACMIRERWSINDIDAELAKCDILCSNCHRIFHHDYRLKHRSAIRDD